MLISLLVSNLLQLEYPFFTVIATIFTIESEKDSPLNAGKTRMFGSIVGAAVAILLVFINPGNPILCGLGMLILIFICNIFDWKKSIPIAGVIFMAIMLGKDIKNPLQYSISRIINTFVGIGIAVLIDYLIPTRRKINE